MLVFSGKKYRQAMPDATPEMLQLADQLDGQRTYTAYNFLFKPTLAVCHPLDPDKEIIVDREWCEEV